MKYTIILSDGQTISNLTLNGTNFVSKTQIDESIFEGNLSTITISDGEEEEVMKNVELIHQIELNDEWYLAFRELSAQEIRDMEIDAKIDYIAMMADVDMEV